jgi:UDP-glucose 4-epimerase
MNKGFYKGKKVLVTGGTGFIGANVAAALVPLGAKVTLLAHSNQTFLTSKISFPKVEIIIGDIRDQALMEKIVKDKDIIFNLAAKVSHMDKGVVSFEDLDINVRGQLTLLEALRIQNPHAKVIFSSTRMVYGENEKSGKRNSSRRIRQHSMVFIN